MLLGVGRSEDVPSWKLHLYYKSNYDVEQAFKRNTASYERKLNPSRFKGKLETPKSRPTRTDYLTEDYYPLFNHFDSHNPDHVRVFFFESPDKNFLVAFNDSSNEADLWRVSPRLEYIGSVIMQPEHSQGRKFTQVEFLENESLVALIREDHSALIYRTELPENPEIPLLRQDSAIPRYESKGKKLEGFILPEFKNFLLPQSNHGKADVKSSGETETRDETAPQ
jgi:hypothetical protein